MENLTLSIMNVADLDVGCHSQYEFDVRGGSIGNGKSENWVLTDRKKNGIKPVHFKVEYTNKCFCIREGAGDIYLNRSTTPLGKVQKTVVEDGDVIGVGPYEIRANLGSASPEDFSFEDGAKKQLGQYTPEEVVRGGNVSHESEMLNSFMSEADGALNVHKNQEIGDINTNDDVLNYASTEQVDESDASLNKQLMCDPLSALDRQQEKHEVKTQSETAKDELVTIVKRKRNMADNTQTQADLTNTTAAAFSSDAQQSPMDVDSIEAELARMGTFDDDTPETVTSGDVDDILSKTLGVNLPSNDPEQLAITIREIGETINRAVEGLNCLFNQSNEIENQRLSSLKLHPIEDNPLRLGRSQNDTLQTLYGGERNPVYLSASSAIEECMNILRQDQQATTLAIDEALGAILNALSPEILVQRFKRYAIESNKEDPDAWAWRMYKYYYSELMSNQKNGFNNLFHSVFSQSYDRNIRSLQK